MRSPHWDVSRARRSHAEYRPQNSRVQPETLASTASLGPLTESHLPTPGGRGGCTGDCCVACISRIMASAGIPTSPGKISLSIAPLDSLLLLVYPNAHGSHHTSAVHHGQRQPRIPSAIQPPTRRPRFHDCGIVPRGQGLASPVGLPSRPTTSRLHGSVCRLSVPYVGELEINL